MVEYTGKEGVLEMADSPIALSEFVLKISRGVASHSRSGKYSDIKLPGKVNVTGTLTRIMIDGAMLGKIIGDTEETGEAAVLHAGLTAPGAAGESVTDMTGTDSKKSLIKFTALTAAITATGYVIIYGTDINDNRITEHVVITTLGINETLTAKKIFKTVTHIVAFDYVQEGGTLKVESVVGASGIVVGKAKFFKLTGKATSGSNHVYVIADNCFLTDGEFAFSNADEILSDTLSFTMKDPDADLKVEYV